MKAVSELHRHDQCFRAFRRSVIIQKGFSFPENPFFVHFIDFFGNFCMKIC